MLSSATPPLPVISKMCTVDITVYNEYQRINAPQTHNWIMMAIKSSLQVHLAMSSLEVYVAVLVAKIDFLFYYWATETKYIPLLSTDSEHG